MAERYRLVFRGEVLEGQHKAVVKERLGAALKLDGARLDAMFTGKAVTIRKDADTDTAARFQIAFKRAGARLRVLPVETEPAAEAVDAPDVAQSTAGDFGLAPAGALLVTPRPDATPPAVDTSHLTLAAPGTVLSTPSMVDAIAPDVSHLTVALPGADLGVSARPPVVAVEPPSWEVASLGVDLTPRSPATKPPFDLDEIDFELAPAGTLLVDADEEIAPAPPDTSHLRLE